MTEKIYLGLSFSMKKPVRASNFLASFSLFIVTLPIEVNPVLRSGLMSYGVSKYLPLVPLAKPNPGGSARCQSATSDQVPLIAVDVSSVSNLNDVDD